MANDVYIRQAVLDDARGIATVHVNVWLSAYRGILSDDVLSQLSVDRSEVMRQERLREVGTFCYVAEATAGRIVGFVDGGLERDGDTDYEGEIYAMYVLTEHQRQGIGLQLFNQAVEWFGSEDISTMLIWVLAANVGARRFYKAMGGRRFDARTISIGGEEHDTVAYGWANLTPGQ